IRRPLENQWPQYFRQRGVGLVAVRTSCPADLGENGRGAVESVPVEGEELVREAHRRALVAVDQRVPVVDRTQERGSEDDEIGLALPQLHPARLGDGVPEALATAKRCGVAPVDLVLIE